MFFIFLLLLCPFLDIKLINVQNTVYNRRNMRLGNKEQNLIRQLYTYGITTDKGEAIWKLIYIQARAHSYETVVYKRIMRLTEKGILKISNDGPRGGKVIYFTSVGFELAQKLTKNNK